MSVTLFQLVSQLARRHAGKGVAELSAAEMLAVVDAVNGGLTRAFSLLPLTFREDALTFSGAPRAGVSCQMTEGDSELGASAFVATEAGRTVIFDGGGDGAWHRVRSESRLELPWLGTTGTWTATVYPDVLAGIDGECVERLSDDPVMVDAGGTRRRLRLLKESDRVAWLGESAKLGTPEFYYLRTAGAANGSTSTFQLGVWPIPAQAVRLVARALWWPRRVRVKDVEGGSVELPVPDAAVEDLIDLCGARLAVLPGWQQVSYADAREAAQRAEARVRSWASQIFRPSNRISTPHGW